MGAVTDFLLGRSNKLLRDMLAACCLVSIFSVMAATYISATVEAMKTSRAPMPPRVITVATQPANGQTTVITRSVLDDPIMTGSISGRPIVLDPCTGKEKK